MKNGGGRTRRSALRAARLRPVLPLPRPPGPALPPAAAVTCPTADVAMVPQAQTPGASAASPPSVGHLTCIPAHTRPAFPCRSPCRWLWADRGPFSYTAALSARPSVRRFVRSCAPPAPPPTGPRSPVRPPPPWGAPRPPSPRPPWRRGTPCPPAGPPGGPAAAEPEPRARPCLSAFLEIRDAGCQGHARPGVGRLNRREVLRPSEQSHLAAGDASLYISFRFRPMNTKNSGLECHSGGAESPPL